MLVLEESRLSLFGSSVNGFGTCGSDMDICLQFKSNEPPPEYDPIDVIKKVQKALEKHKSCHKVYSIKTAKVPIVKFCVVVPLPKPMELEGDISFYNCLASHNSRMLLTYAEIDKRVQVLGYCLKLFAKVCLLLFLILIEIYFC